MRCLQKWCRCASVVVQGALAFQEKARPVSECLASWLQPRHHNVQRPTAAAPSAKPLQHPLAIHCDTCRHSTATPRRQSTTKPSAKPPQCPVAIHRKGPALCPIRPRVAGRAAAAEPGPTAGQRRQHARQDGHRHDQRSHRLNTLLGQVCHRQGCHHDVLASYSCSRAYPGSALAGTTFHAVIHGCWQPSQACGQTLERDLGATPASRVAHELGSWQGLNGAVVAGFERDGLAQPPGLPAEAVRVPHHLHDGF
eukprot:351429-Chlamydomonas_euryale.AAC.4